MQLYRKDGLRQIHLVVGVHDRVGHRAAKVVALDISAAYDHVLRDRPAAIAHVVENEEMAEECLCLFARELAAIGFKNTVYIAE